MRTDPPAGDELASMLVTMRGEVMKAALRIEPGPELPERASMRGRAIMVAIALVGLLVVGGTGAALAAGMIPNPFDQSPTPTPAPTITNTPAPTTSPTSTPSSTPTVPAPAPAPVVDPLDPGTWIVDYKSVGGLALGDPIAPFGTAAGLQPNPSPIDCPSGFYKVANFDEESFDVSVVLVQLDARVTPVDDPVLTYAVFSTRFAAPDGPLPDSPSTLAGIRIGSSEEELLTAYPDIVTTTSRYDDTMGFTTYAEGPLDGRYLVFRVGTSDSGLRTVKLLQTSTIDVAIDICD